MKMILLAVALIAGVSTIASADMPGKDWMTMEQVTQKLHDMGFTSVTELEADDGHWEGDAVKDGQTYEVHVDPRTGVLTKNEPKH
jgi:hypothetical protein